MNAQRVAALFFWGLAHAVLAAETPAKDEPTREERENLSKYSVGLLQARLSTEQKQLETVEAQLTTLQGEIQKARARQEEVRAQQFDSSRASAALAKFQKNFATVTDMLRSGLPNLGNYQALLQSEHELMQVILEAMGGYLPSYAGKEQRSSVQEELYANPRWTTDLPSKMELEMFKLPAIGKDGSDLFQTQMKEAVSANAERVKNLTVSGLERWFIKDREAVIKAWEEIITRAQTGIAAREAQVKGFQATIDRLSVELSARQRTEIENDVRMNWAVLMMIIALAVLFLATRLFTPEVQLVIFQQRTLVEMIGLAFLLLTIIILGTSGKIETSVLGTLLGTVGGYIFGQQVQARRNAAREEQESTRGTGPGKEPVTRKELQEIVLDLQRMVRQAPPETTTTGNSSPPDSKNADSAKNSRPPALP